VLPLIAILNGNVNKNYRLALERLYGRRILKNTKRKLSSERGMRITPTNGQV
jgi:uncharacterized protein (DUF2384 family)